MGRYLFEDKRGSLLIDFMWNVFRQRVSLPIAKYMVERIPGLEMEFKGSPDYAERSFLEFLSQKLGLQ